MENLNPAKMFSNLPAILRAIYLLSEKSLFWVNLNTYIDQKSDNDVPELA